MSTSQKTMPLLVVAQGLLGRLGHGHRPLGRRRRGDEGQRWRPRSRPEARASGSGRERPPPRSAPGGPGLRSGCEPSSCPERLPRGGRRPLAAASAPSKLETLDDASRCWRRGSGRRRGRRASTRAPRPGVETYIGWPRRKTRISAILSRVPGKWRSRAAATPSAISRTRSSTSSSAAAARGAAGDRPSAPSCGRFGPLPGVEDPVGRDEVGEGRVEEPVVVGRLGADASSGRR